MNKVDLSPLITGDSAYEKICDSLTARHKSGWDDEVHASFIRFVNQIQANGEKLHSIRVSAELIDTAVDALNIDDLNQTAQRLVKEADSI